MAAEKRAASGSFSSSQLVKRQKSDYDLNNGAIALSNGTGKSGSLTKSVSNTASLYEHKALCMLNALSKKAG